MRLQCRSMGLNIQHKLPAIENVVEIYVVRRLFYGVRKNIEDVPVAPPASRRDVCLGLWCDAATLRRCDTGVHVCRAICKVTKSGVTCDLVLHVAFRGRALVLSVAIGARYGL